MSLAVSRAQVDITIIIINNNNDIHGLMAVDGVFTFFLQEQVNSVFVKLIFLFFIDCTNLFFGIPKNATDKLFF